MEIEYAFLLSGSSGNAGSSPRASFDVQRVHSRVIPCRRRECLSSVLTDKALVGVLKALVQRSGRYNDFPTSRSPSREPGLGDSKHLSLFNFLYSQRTPGEGFRMIMLFITLL